MSHTTYDAAFAFALSFAALTTACTAQIVRVEVPAAAPAATATVFRAGVAEVDLTPPPGAPLFGYALLSGAAAAKGYRTRLKAHVIVLEGPAGGRFALVQVDLGAPSRLVHQLVARQVSSLGIGPDRLILAATHTHAGPGGFFENGFYNDFGAGWVGFDPALTGFIATSIGNAIASAVGSLAPAKIAAETVHVPFVTFNRSPEAARENICPGCGGTKVPDVDDRLHMLRVDRVVGSGTEPIGAFAVFAVHGTAVAETNQLYHGDVPGYAARRLTALVRSAHPGAVGFVGAVANGAEGDVSPTKSKQGFAEAELVGRAIGKAAFDAYETAGAHLSADVDLGHAYRELVVPGAHTVAGDVCDTPMIGIPTIAGAEDGPSFFRGKFGVYEGRRKNEPRGCQGTKEPALGSLTERFVLGGRMPGLDTMPRIGAFNVTALYHRRGASSKPDPIVVYATVPGEPTTAVGHAVAERVALELVPAPVEESPPVKSKTDDPSDKVAVIGLSNAYLGYFTSSAEYAAQAYEGGSTFYGPLQSLLAVEQLQALAGRVRERLPVAGIVTAPPLRERSADSLFYTHNDYQPGPPVHFFGERTDCAAGERDWAALGVTHMSKAGKLDHVTFQWTGLHKDFFCPPPKIAIVCGGAPLVDRFGQAETDDGTRFEVSRKGAAQWSLAFFPTETELGQPRCSFQIGRTGAAPLTSPEFSL